MTPCIADENVGTLQSDLFSDILPNRIETDTLHGALGYIEGKLRCVLWPLNQCAGQSAQIVERHLDRPIPSSSSSAFPRFPAIARPGITIIRIPSTRHIIRGGPAAPSSPVGQPQTTRSSGCLLGFGNHPTPTSVGNVRLRSTSRQRKHVGQFVRVTGFFRLGRFSVLANGLHYPIAQLSQRSAYLPSLGGVGVVC